MQAIVIGGGAAGIFGAIHLALNGYHVTLLEKHRQLLAKVKVSGGGRCNVTHACFDVKELIKNYPRGSKELLGPFHRFSPLQTIDWFKEQGVDLKIEEDKRMFPITDSSQTIIDCFLNLAQKLSIEIIKECGLEEMKAQKNGLELTFSDGRTLTSSYVLLATGSSSKIWELLRKLGHTIEEPIPSLFTFNTPSSPFLDLAGITIDTVRISLPNGYFQDGPLLFTHWGLSGPSVLKLSAFAAKALYQANYYTTFWIDFIPALSAEAVEKKLEEKRQTAGKMNVKTFPLFDLPRRLWEKLLKFSDIKESQVYSQLSRRQVKLLIDNLKKTELFMEGKTTNKEEFVTCGGVTLSEVNFNTMESKIVPGLYFAGEILNIDGITGGFNFQAAWTTAYIAAQKKELREAS